jgi:hypothetical protein
MEFHYQNQTNVSDEKADLIPHKIQHKQLRQPTVGLGPWKKNKPQFIAKVNKENLLVTNEVLADKSLARPGRKQATATEDFQFHISYL